MHGVPSWEVTFSMQFQVGNAVCGSLSLALVYYEVYSRHVRSRC